MAEKHKKMEAIQSKRGMWALNVIIMSLCDTLHLAKTALHCKTTQIGVI
jgi:hypothetical protein